MLGVAGWSRPAKARSTTEEKSYHHGGGGNHVCVFAQEKERELHRAVLGVIAPTSSLSDSGKSKGKRLVSANAATTKIRKEIVA